MSKFDWKVLDRNYEDVIYETYNGIAKNENGQWYVKDGRIDFTYSGTVTFGQTSYVIKYGKVESQGTMK